MNSLKVGTKSITSISSIHFLKKLLNQTPNNNRKKSIQQVVLFEVEDKPFENKLLNFLEGIDVHLEVLPSPMFKLTRHEFSDFKGHKNTLRMGSFYKDMRKQFDVLLDENNDPIGGRWSFDEDNRKKIPAGTLIPKSLLEKDPATVHR